MASLNSFNLVFRRSLGDFRLILAILSGMIVATTLISSAPIYMDSMDQQGIRKKIDKVVQNRSENYLALDMSIPSLVLSEETISNSDILIRETINSYWDEATLNLNRYIKTNEFSFYKSLKETSGDPKADFVSSQVGYFQSFQTMDRQITYITGLPPSSDFQFHPDGPLLEVSISTGLSEALSIGQGDVFVGTPFPDSRVKLGVRVSGVFEANDYTDPIWGDEIEKFLMPLIPTNDESENSYRRSKEQEYYLAFFISEKIMMNSVPHAYPGSMAEVNWNQQIDHLVLRDWTRDEITESLDGLDGFLTKKLNGFQLRSGILIMLKEYKTQSLFSSVPILLLLTVTGSALLYFVFMISSYLVPARESDISLVKTRGASTWTVLRQYGLEGCTLSLCAILFSPFFAFFLVYVVGLLPYFQGATDGNPLPVTFSIKPFVFSSTFGVLCLIAFLIPPILRTSRGVIGRRRKAGRPESVTFIQKYFLDIAFLVICGLLLYEIKSRGQISSGGLGDGTGINEALFFTPVLLFFSVSILSFRVFPILVRFITGESPGLVLLIGFSAVILVFYHIGIMIFSDLDTSILMFKFIALVFLVVGLLSFLKTKSKYGDLLSVGLFILMLVVWGLYVATKEGGLLTLLTTWVLLLLSALAALFLLLNRLRKFFPPWVSLVLWNMSRNPLQYTWMVVLLVLSSGVLVLAVTLGSTLEKTYRERVFYHVGSDAKISMSSGGYGLQHSSVSESSDFFEDLPGVKNSSKAKRGVGHLGEGMGSFAFNYLAMEAGNFDLWSREDFSREPMESLMSEISHEILIPALKIPEGSTEIGLNVKPNSKFPLISLWLILRDADNKYKIVTLGKPEPYKWSKRKVPIPDSLNQPIQLVSIQLSEPGLGASGTPGNIFFDDLFVTMSGKEVLVENFETYSNWSVIPTAIGSSDSISLIEGASVSGRHGFSYDFGKEMNNGIRGLYWAEYGSYLPVLVSRSFIKDSGFTVDDYLLMNISQALVTGKIVGEVDFYSTLDPNLGAFLISNLDALIYFSSLIDIHKRDSVNEVFINFHDSEENTILNIEDKIGTGSEIQTTKTLLEDLDNDPIVSTGWRLMTMVSILVSIYIAVIGYFIHMVFLSNQIKSRMGTLRSMGITLAQSFKMIFVEQVFLIFIGIGLGSCTGILMTRLMVSEVMTTDTGRPVIPPPITSIDFAPLIISSVVFFILFTLMVIWISFHFFKINLGTLSRLEE